MNRLLRSHLRQQNGRNEQPRASIIANQTVKPTSVGGSRGYALPLGTRYLAGDMRQEPGNRYDVRTRIAYGCKQIKNECGRVDRRLTDDATIERWWEQVFRAYLLVSLHTPVLVQNGNDVAIRAAPACRHA